jgi:hypothetical protein
MKACYLCGTPKVFTRVKRVLVCQICARSWGLPIDPPPAPVTRPAITYVPDDGSALEEARRVMRLDDKFNKYMPHYGDDLEELPF